VCLVAVGNPPVADALTVDQVRSMPWVVLYHGPTAATPAARQMRMLGIEPDMRVVTENFLTVPGLVADSDRVALLQRRLAGAIRAAKACGCSRARSRWPVGRGHLVASDVRRRPRAPVSARHAGPGREELEIDPTVGT
jgi:hypothetical protein